MCNDCDGPDRLPATARTGSPALTRRGLLKGLGVGGLGLFALADGALGPGARRAYADGPDPRLITATPRILPRSTWAGSTCPVRGPLPVELPGDVKFLLVHHTAEPGNDYTGSQVPDLMRGMYRYHVGPAKGWSDLAYNFVVDRYGGIWEGRAGSLTAPVIPGATGGTQGFDQLGCFLGDHATAVPTPQAQASMISLLAWLARRYGVDTTPGATVSFLSRGSNRLPAGSRVTTPTIEGHRAMSLTTCPGDAAYPLVRDVFPAAVTLLNAGAATAIGQLHLSLGGDGGLLGPARTGVLGTPDGVGRYVHYRDGSIYWTPGTGAHEVHGSIAATWAALGWETGPLGYPVTDERTAPDGRGRYNHFRGGSVYWSPATGAHEVRGSIGATWSSLGWERSWLGYPTSNEYAVPAGRAQDFEGGRATWSAGTGAVVLTHRG